MRDHGEFISSSLSYNEQEAINFALFYKNAFSRIHIQTKNLYYNIGNEAVNYIINDSMII